VIYEKLVDFLFPKICVGCGREGSVFCETCISSLRKATQKCPGCTKKSSKGRRHKKCEDKTELLSLKMFYSYKDEKVRKAIEKMKYGFDKSILEKVLVGKRIVTKADWVVPVPLFWYRENWRGFNQAEVIARLVGGERTVNCLYRKFSWKHQAQISEIKERQKNVQGLFELRESFVAAVRGKTIVLVDDVYTTGATMSEAAKVLIKAGAKRVSGWVLAG
jgi:ComF family protein